MLKPKVKITYGSKYHVNIVITCKYPASKAGNTADKVWDIVADFSSIKTILPNIISNYITYPDTKQTKKGTVRYMTFGGPTITTGIEVLTQFNNDKRNLTYISLKGLPVKNYQGVVKVTGKNACTLTWTITYDQKPIDKKFAKTIAGFFIQGELEIGKVIGIN